MKEVSYPRLLKAAYFTFTRCICQRYNFFKVLVGINSDTGKRLTLLMALDANNQRSLLDDWPIRHMLSRDENDNLIMLTVNQIIIK